MLSAASAPPRPAPVTYNKHVAPILFKHCASCHRPGEIGPFSLLTYKDAAKRAGFLKEVTGARRMPPWKPVPGYGDFQDTRRLSDAEINILARWADTGAPQGDPRDLPPAPKFTEGWQLGKPDLILKMPEAFTVPAGGRDIYRCFVLPTGLKKKRAVAAVEFRPGNRRAVHHAVIAIDTSGAARKKDKADGKPGFRSPGGTFGIPVAGFLGGWSPGATPRRLPDGVGRRLPAGSDLVVQIHYPATGKEEKDQSAIGLFFTRKPPEKFVRVIVLPERRLRIPAGEKQYRVSARYTLPVDVHAIGVLPHMHLLGREMKLTAGLPDGKKQPMIWIKDWDFNWQGQYQYAREIALPKGTVLHLEASFDNSAGNPKNPNSPPRVVRNGPRTTDEMCECRVQITIDRPKTDGATLIKDLARTGRERRSAYRKWLRGEVD
jgi:hypothetical protein